MKQFFIIIALFLGFNVTCSSAQSLRWVLDSNWTPHLIEVQKSDGEWLIYEHDANGSTHLLTSYSTSEISAVTAQELKMFEAKNIMVATILEIEGGEQWVLAVLSEKTKDQFPSLTYWIKNKDRGPHDTFMRGHYMEYLTQRLDLIDGEETSPNYEAPRPTKEEIIRKYLDIKQNPRKYEPNGYVHRR